MRQEAARRVQMLLVIWSLLSLGTGFPTRHKSVGHKVSWLPHMADAFLKQQVKKNKIKKNFKSHMQLIKLTFQDSAAVPSVHSRRGSAGLITECCYGVIIPLL